MNRKHTRDFYYEIIDKLRSSRADMAFSSDFIVGFPGEREDDHKKTLELIEHVEFAQAYSFKYSIRPGTPAGMHELQVPEEIKARRLQEVQDLLLKQQLTFNQNTMGKTIPVLFEKKGRHEGQIIGRSPYMQAVFVEGTERLLNQISMVKIEKTLQNSLNGSVETTERVENGNKLSCDNTPNIAA
jgi:tRNA-2-methylthio-N6-dimethylallyladenosine synthase